MTQAQGLGVTGGFDLKVKASQVFQGEDRRWIKVWEPDNFRLRPVTLDASAFFADNLSAKGAVPSGTALQKLASGLYGPAPQTAAGTGTNETQTITVTATGGHYELNFDGDGPTVAIVYNGNDAAIKAALEGLDNIDFDEVSVTSKVVTFKGRYADTNVPLMTVTDVDLSGGTVTVGETAAGTYPAADGFLFTTTKIGDGSGTDLATAGDVGVAMLTSAVIDTNFLPLFGPTNHQGELTEDCIRSLVQCRFES